MDRSPTIVSPDQSLVDALGQMQGRRPCYPNQSTSQPNGQQSSYVLVVDRGRPLGIVTECDIVRLSAAGETLSSLQVQDVMTPNLQTLTWVPGSPIIQVLPYFQQARMRHLPVVDQQGLLLGMITLEGLRRSLQPVNYLRQRRVSELMTQPVIWIPPTETLVAAASRMAQHRISSLVVAVQMNDCVLPQGILTERDIVQLQIQGVNFDATIVADVMSHPVIHVSPNSSLQATEQLMQKYCIRRVVVIDEHQNLQGILTQTNLIQLYDPLECLHIIHNLKQQLQVLQDVVVQHNQDLETTNQRLCLEIKRRERVEHNLRTVQQALSYEFGQRTRALIETNQKLRQEVLERQCAESRLKAANLELQYRLAELAQRNQEIALLGKLSHYLHACQTIEEAYGILPKLLASMFPQVSGRLYLFGDVLSDFNNDSNHAIRAQLPSEYADQAHDLTSHIITWGTPAPPLCSTTSLAACWAIRQGQAHQGHQGQVDRSCQHCMITEDWRHRVCIPMLTQGQSIGLLLLGTNWEISESTHQLAVTVAEHVALALANLKLRGDLRHQSIRDPLTGLFNRRYLQTVLDQELEQAEQHQQKLSLIMLDIDYFKRLNDTLGHEAGDRVLQQLGRLLLSNSRSTDVICRYGGEEIILILPNTDLKSAYCRAEKLRQQIKHFQFFPSPPLQKTGFQPSMADYPPTASLDYPSPTVTVSLGISSFPLHGKSPNELLRAADGALYQAKRLGRDRVAVASYLSEQSSTKSEEAILPPSLLPN
ncbi:diguanylate cyclase [Alkalinema sp. FACHB-956]|uniref:diguanylate cyclase n=1 Tax=Alkalinema sp. FACHB-956 TaxID=2692768 RepID=UPI001688C971|nr:diguanylate cyclase [Alkalinema sp. FACHB-956]MBD2326564.1 diguanylate cyclase [Alkalinema sp. FACHB-956]